MWSYFYKTSRLSKIALVCKNHFYFSLFTLLGVCSKRKLFDLIEIMKIKISKNNFVFRNIYALFSINCCMRFF
jgi:hypothetical protein